MRLIRGNPYAASSVIAHHLDSFQQQLLGGSSETQGHWQVISHEIKVYIIGFGSATSALVSFGPVR